MEKKIGENKLTYEKDIEKFRMIHRISISTIIE